MNRLEALRSYDGRFGAPKGKCNIGLSYGQWLSDRSRGHLPSPLCLAIVRPSCCCAALQDKERRSPTWWEDLYVYFNTFLRTVQNPSALTSDSLFLVFQTPTSPRRSPATARHTQGLARDHKGLRHQPVAICVFYLCTSTVHYGCSESVLLSEHHEKGTLAEEICPPSSLELCSRRVTHEISGRYCTTSTVRQLSVTLQGKITSGNLEYSVLKGSYRSALEALNYFRDSSRSDTIPVLPAAVALPLHPDSVRFFWQGSRSGGWR